MSTLQERLKLLRGSTSQADFARKLGVTQSSLGRYERGESIPDAMFIQALFLGLGVEPRWFVSGEGPAYDPSRTKVVEATCESPCDAPLTEVVPIHPRNGVTYVEHADARLTMVPMVEARLSAGTGSFETSADVRRLYAFRSDWISAKGQTTHMVLMRVAGDSMEPHIMSNDVVLIDQSQTTPRAGGLFAVAVEDLVYLKVVDAVPGKLILKSYNEAYPPLEIDARGDLANGIRIIGKALWIGRDLQ